MTEAEFEQHMREPLEGTLLRLGQVVYSPPTAAFPRPIAEYVAAARKYLADRRAVICQAIHNNPVTRDYLEGKSTYKIAQIGGIIVDLVSLACKLPAAGACWASVALLQLGLDQFCDGICKGATSPKEERPH